MDLCKEELTMTRSITLKSHVGPDGVLHLQVPVGIANTDLEIVLVVVPVEAASKTPEALGWPAGFFEETAGSLPALERPPQGEWEVRDALA